jgi:cytochrome b subunit of formate dehydrogenase
MDECLEVRFSGTWLKDFGFEFGHKVVVEVTAGQIVIKARVLFPVLPIYFVVGFFSMILCYSNYRVFQKEL